MGAKDLTGNDLAGLHEGHKRLILNMVSRLRTPVRERPQTKFPSFSEKSPASKSPARKKTVLSAGEASVGQEAQWSQREASVSRPTIRRKLLSHGERFIKEKHHAVEEKLAEAAEKRKKCWKIVTEDSKRLLPKITLPANDTVIAITEIILFAVVRWKSASQYFSVAK